MPGSETSAEVGGLAVVKALPFALAPLGEAVFTGGIFSSDFGLWLLTCFGVPLVWTVALGVMWLAGRRRSTAWALLGAPLTLAYWAVRVALV